MPRDPVCGMNVRDRDKSLRSEFRGQTYHFCSDRCMTTFEQDPETFTQLLEDGKSQKQRRRKKQDEQHERLS
ncbi:MAG TPA: YHS domain-containing protein [Firmicutes bacterium]|jgi:Cu+-exporting ATPase|nr:YHS domain-containing protein [Bacillota bacterium]